MLTNRADTYRLRQEPGVAVHDAGKILHPQELREPGALHELAGEALLLKLTNLRVADLSEFVRLLLRVALACASLSAGAQQMYKCKQPNDTYSFQAAPCDVGQPQQIIARANGGALKVVAPEHTNTGSVNASPSQAVSTVPVRPEPLVNPTAKPVQDMSAATATAPRDKVSFRESLAAVLLIGLACFAWSLFKHFARNAITRRSNLKRKPKPIVIDKPKAAATFKTVNFEMIDRVPAPNTATGPYALAISPTACLQSLAMHERSYLNIAAPKWITTDPVMLKSFFHYPDLWDGGTVVWGRIVQANGALFEPGTWDAPGEMVYDPSGTASPLQLETVARQLFALKHTKPQDPHRLEFANYLTDEKMRAVGMHVPSSISSHPLYVSTVFFCRSHLPFREITELTMPVLINMNFPGVVMVLPGRWWPEELLETIRRGRTGSAPSPQAPKNPTRPLPGPRKGSTPLGKPTRIVHTPAPKIDDESLPGMTQQAQERADGIPKILKSAKAGSIFSLNILADAARRAAGCRYLLDPQSAEVLRLLHVNKQARDALFAWTRAAPKAITTMPLGAGEPATLLGVPPIGNADVLTWLDAFFLNLVFGDWDALCKVCEVSTALLSSPTTRASKHAYLFKDALCAFVNGAPDTEARLREALTTANQGGPETLSAMWSKHMLVPALEAFHCAVTGDANFTAAMQKAIKLHQSYVASAEDRANDPAHVISVNLLGIAALGMHLGQRLDVQLPYLPVHLIQKMRLAARGPAPQLLVTTSGATTRT